MHSKLLALEGFSDFNRIWNMSDSPKKRRFVSPGTVISVLAVFLYCAGFIRTELKLEKQNKRIETLEKSLADRGRPHSQQKTMMHGELLHFIFVAFCKANLKIFFFTANLLPY